MADRIPLIPEVPATLREASQIGKLVPFVGAGASLLAGCPNWVDFADRCFDVFLEQGRFSHSQLEQIRSLNPRIKLSIALALQEEHKIKIDFPKILHPKGRSDASGQRLFAALTKLGNTLVTTNYDEWLDEEVVAPPASVAEAGNAKTMPAPRTVYYKVADLTAAHLNERNVVIHLHGSIREPGEMILTTADYIQHYAYDRRKQTEGENFVLTFLDDLFTHKVVLFVGYGLAELEILEYIIVKTRRLASTGTEPRHFVLQGFFSHEYDLMNSLKQYYRQCGIELLPFLKDRKGHVQLLDVLEAFAAAMPASGPMLAQEFLEMEGLLDA